MDDTIRVFSGREFTTEDIELIKWTRKTYHKLSRRELASTVCELLNWTTPSGAAKWPQCLEFIGKLEVEGIIQLPPLKGPDRKGCKVKIPELNIKFQEIRGETREYEPIRLEIARPGDALKRWRYYVNQYHMLGDKQTFGSRLQYFVKSGDLELGCLQFSASSWALEEREKWIGWGIEDRKANLHLIVNNSRFLIFPWVHISYYYSPFTSLNFLSA